MDSAVKFPLVSSSYTGLGNDSSSDDGSSQEPAGFSICRVMLLNTLSGKKCGTLKSPAKMQFKLEYFSRSCLMISCIPSNMTFVSNNCTSIRRGLWWAGFAVRWTAPIMIAWGRTSSCPTHVRMTNRTMLLFVAYLSRCCLLKLPSKRDRHGVNLVVLSSKSVALLSSNFELLQNTATPTPESTPVYTLRYPRALKKGWIWSSYISTSTSCSTITSGFRTRTSCKMRAHLECQLDCLVPRLSHDGASTFQLSSRNLVWISSCNPNSVEDAGTKCRAGPNPLAEVFMAIAANMFQARTIHTKVGDRQSNLDRILQLRPGNMHQQTRHCSLLS